MTSCNGNANLRPVFVFINLSLYKRNSFSLQCVIISCSDPPFSLLYVMHLSIPICPIAALKTLLIPYILYKYNLNCFSPYL